MSGKGLWAEVVAFAGCAVLLAGIFAWNQASTPPEVPEPPAQHSAAPMKTAPPAEDVGAGRKITPQDGAKMMEPGEAPFILFNCPRCLVDILDAAANVYSERVEDTPKQTID